GGVRDREAGLERQGRAGDDGDAAVVLEQVVAGRVFLAAVVEDAEPVAVRRHRQGGLPLVGGGEVVVDLDRGAPGDAAVGGLHQEDVALVGAGPPVVVGDVDVP